jgi:hypothetical protein
METTTTTQLLEGTGVVDPAHIVPTDLFMEAGMSPADDHEVRWVAERYEAVVDLPDGYLLASEAELDGDVWLIVTTPSGVIRSEMRFDVTPFGLVAFVGAAAAIAQAVRS